MKFEKYFPREELKDYIRHFVVSENDVAATYKVFPSSGLVIGFQYKGNLSAIHSTNEQALSPAGITGISDSYRIFKNTPDIGTILVYFTETGFTHFASLPANELFNLSISLEDIFDKSCVNEVSEKLTFAKTDIQRIHLVEGFLLSQLKDIRRDKLIVEAVRRIYQSKGTIWIKDLNEQLYISPSPFEKRFRKIVGTTPKKFASIVRFNTILNSLDSNKSLIDICYEHRFFDQAHFIKDFRQYTGDTPERFKRFL